MKAVMSTYNTSNERKYLSLSIGVSNSEIKHEREIGCEKLFFFHFYFSNVHIVRNNLSSIFKLFLLVDNIHAEGTVSQILVLAPSYLIM